MLSFEVNKDVYISDRRHEH